MLCTQDPCFDHFINFLFLEWLAYPSSYPNIPLKRTTSRIYLIYPFRAYCEIFQIPKLHYLCENTYPVTALLQLLTCWNRPGFLTSTVSHHHWNHPTSTRTSKTEKSAVFMWSWSACTRNWNLSPSEQWKKSPWLFRLVLGMKDYP